MEGGGAHASEKELSPSVPDEAVIESYYRRTSSITYSTQLPGRISLLPPRRAYFWIGASSPLCTPRTPKYAVIISTSLTPDDPGTLPRQAFLTANNNAIGSKNYMDSSLNAYPQATVPDY